LPALAARWLDRAPAGWDALLAADPSASPSHRPAVAAAFAEALPAHEPCILALEEGGRLVGGVPFVETRRGPFRWLYALPLQLPAPPLASPGRHAEVDAAAAAAVRERAAERGLVGGAWSWYRAAGPAPAEAALAAVPGETRTLEAGLVDLTGGTDAALARMDRKERQALRGARANALAFGEDPGALEAAWLLHDAQSRGWGGRAPLPLEVSRRLLLPRGGEPVARLFALRDARGVVAAALVLDGPHETFAWWSGTHPVARASGAPGVLLWRIAEWAARAGRARLNLGASAGLPGVASFKRSLGADAFRYPLRWFDASRAGPAGRLVAGLQSFARRGRRRGDPA
jgi:CelD/BcsL family acetyltransferase involved in cellulose biosynthesis